MLAASVAAEVVLLGKIR